MLPLFKLIPVAGARQKHLASMMSFPFLLFLALKELAELLIGPMPLDRIPLLEVRFFR